MANYAYERLTPHDASFLLFESPNTHMHIAWAWIFDGGSLVSDDGGVDIARIRQHVSARLFRFPRFRQRIAYTPIENHPVWVDDENFKLHYHVRHASLTEPGDLRRLKTTVSSIVSQPLDRSKPLWEMWIIEGLADGRFCVVTKTHHCMVDGVSTVDLMTGLLDPAPIDEPEDAVDWIPRPAPTRQELLRDAIFDRIGMAASLTQKLSEDLEGLTRSTKADVVSRLTVLRDTVSASMTGAPETPVNQPPGPHRFVSWLRIERAEIREVAERLEGSTQDVLLAVVAGAIWRNFKRQNFRLRRQSFRVVVPTPSRDAPPPKATGPGELGNRASGWIIPMPVDEANAMRRFRAIVRTTSRMQSSNQAIGMERLLQAAEIGGSFLLSAGVGAQRRLHPYNLIVSRIPGPREPRFLLDATLEEAYPHLPLFENQSLIIGVAAYLDYFDIGVTADWEVTPDLEPFVEDLRASLDELQMVEPKPRPRRRARVDRPAGVAEREGTHV